jgi:hypothetical protein
MVSFRGAVERPASATTVRILALKRLGALWPAALCCARLPLM